MTTHPGHRVDEEPTEADLADVAHQLGRPLRGRTRVAHRCECGAADVVATAPRLPDGTPFPTLYYLTCPRATGAVSTLESDGVMREFADRLAEEPELAAAYLAAHEAYLSRRDELATGWGLDVPEIAGVSAGGMPDRVKCLHVLVGHALAAGPGVNPLGDEAVARLPQWWAAGKCRRGSADNAVEAGGGGSDVAARHSAAQVRVGVDGDRVRRVAAIDCGTNSLRLLIADVDGAGRLSEISRVMRIVRLGQGVDATGLIAPEAMSRALAVTEEYARACAAAGVEAVRFVATSATRDARNAAEFVDGVTRVLGVAPEVISGAEEAELSFRGATAGLGVTGEVCVVDLGGGSTEVVTGTLTADGRLQGGLRAYSMDIGCVRLSERHLRSDPPTMAEIEAATSDIDRHLDAAERDVPLGEVTTLIGVAGTVTTITAHVLALPEYDSDIIHGQTQGVPETLAACADLLHRPRSARAALGFMHEGRVDVIGAGALIWSRVIERVVARASIDRVVTSEHDILDGIALRLGQR